MTRNELDQLVHKANQLDTGDEIRREVLVCAHEWNEAETPEDREQIERELEWLRSRLAY